MDFYFDIDIIYSPLAQALVGLGLAAALFLIVVYRGNIARVAKHYRLSMRSRGDSDEGLALPSLSVIVYCKDSARALERMLPEVLAQKFDAPFEVIVANDGRNGDAEDVVKLLSCHHRNLRMTYVPDDAHALSRKKLAVTLGIKAARYDYVVLTDANVRIESHDWLCGIARHFARGKEVVIATSYPVGERRLHGMGRYNMLADKATYLSSAISGKPYRATECNMAFRRKLFFGNNGFTSSVELHHGIDDIFLSGIVSADNYAVELSKPTQIGCSTDAFGGKYNVERVRYEFTGRHLSHCMRRMMGAGSVAMWTWLATTVAAGILLAPNLLPLAALLIAGVAWITTTAVAWAHVSQALQVPVNAWLTPFYMLWRPVTTLFTRITGYRLRATNYTWAKPLSDKHL